MANKRISTQKQGNLKQPTEKQLAARAKFALAAKQRAKKGLYSLSVLIGGKTFESKTDDMQGAILALKPEKITNRVMITAQKGDRKVEKLLFVRQARRIFYNPLAAQFFVKNLTMSLN